MDKRTEEYDAIIKTTAKLTRAVKNELTPLSQELVARELISVDQGVEMRNGNVGAVDRAANLVALVTNKVEQNRKNFYRFVEALIDNRSVYKDILESLEPIYKTGELIIPHCSLQVMFESLKSTSHNPAPLPPPPKNMLGHKTIVILCVYNYYSKD